MDAQIGAAEGSARLKPYRPRAFNRDSRKRFRRIVRLELMAALGREATPVQRRTVMRIADLEWQIAVSSALLEKGKLSDAGVRNMISLDRQARIYRRELGLGPRRRASRPAAPKPEPKPKVEVEPASEPEPEPESDLVGYLQRKANGGTSP